MILVHSHKRFLLTYLTVPKPRLTMIRSIQASARFTAETNSATRIKPFAVMEGERGGEGGKGGRNRVIVAMAHSYTADLRFSPTLTELYSDTKKVFSRNPRMITAPIQNCL